MFDPYTVPENRRPRRPRRSGLGRSIGLVVALVATVPVIIFGLRLAHSGPSQLATSAGTQGLLGYLAGGHTGSRLNSGWGHGGYPMMPGPAGADPSSGTYPSSGAVSGSAGLGPDNAADAMSANWAGYAAAQSQGSFTSVSASWTQPTVTCTDAESFSAFWVGLDGDGTATVEQTGTEADCADGTPSYQGWYELFPNAPVVFANPVQP